MAVLVGTSNGETITGFSGDDQIDALGGNDILDGGPGADTVNGGDGDDFISLSDTQDAIDGGAGSDQLYLYFGASSVGVTLDLTALWTGGVGIMSSSLGSGTIVSMESLYPFSTTGSNFNDTITFGDIAISNVGGGGGDDELNGGSQGDGLSGGGGNDTLNGGGGNDGLAGDAGADTVNGGEGDDFISVIDTLDIIDGGNGIDTVYFDFSSSTVGVAVDFTALWTGGVGTMSSSLGSGTMTHMESLYGLYNTGSSLADTLAFGDIATSGIDGMAGDDEIDGGFRSDGFHGGFGNDILNGGGGDDVLAGDAGADTVDGGDGNDLISISDSLDTIDGGSGTDIAYFDLTAAAAGINLDLRALWKGDVGKVSSSLGSGTIANVEELYFAHNEGSAFTDRIRLGDVACTFNGNGGNDRIYGGKFADSLSGGIGNDALVGNAGTDHLSGGDGDDVLIGGRGADALSGGAGRDTFSFSRAGESRRTQFDTVADFDAAADYFDFGVAVSAVDTPVDHGELDMERFCAKIAAAVGTLGAHHAVLFTADSGTLSGHTYLVVDGNGTANYQGGRDFIVELQGATNLGSLSPGNFL
jgi:Ca2+-binding RTX toxin-like protein